MTRVQDPMDQMVEMQLEARGIRDPLVLAAMRAVDRARFLPESEVAYAYEDGPLAIGFGQTISQPYIVALMTEALRLRGDERVLEIGVGSGYQTAILCAIGCQVFGVERIPELTSRAQSVLRRLGYHPRLVTADGTLGWPGRVTTFDAALVAAASPGIPPSILRQIRPGGRMVIPVGDRGTQKLQVVRKRKEGAFETRTIEFVRFVPLIGREGYG